MQGYYRKLLIVVAAGIALSLLMWVVNSGALNRNASMSVSGISLLETPENILTEDASEFRKQVLILKSGEEISEKLGRNLKKVCRYMKLDSNIVDISRKESVSYADYDIVIIATMGVEEGLGRDLERILKYVEEGGRLFWAIMPDHVGNNFQSVYRQLGILNLGDFTEVKGITFQEELIPGSKGLSFSGDNFTDSALELQLEENCKVYVEAENSSLPVVWSKDYGVGRIVFYNATASAVDYLTGMLGGCIGALYDEFMYPSLNAKVVFIDDFPSPQYNSESDVIKAEYNRTVREFYRDIWWPDMQSAAKRYNLAYTGLFMATYNNIVDPQYFEFTRDDMEQYFGDSLIKNGFEMGAHGYNHQSLTLAGGTPKEMAYEPWASEVEMAASITRLVEITKEMFPGVIFKTYVPPSNYLSPEGRKAIVKALPNLEVISGVYTAEGEEGDVYVQEFEIAEDGIAEFPRLTAGMLEGDYEDFVTINGCGLYGVFSHFIHPDDILDPERSRNQTWQVLLDGFCKKVNLVNERYQGMRALTASEAADALRIADALELKLEHSENRISGTCYNYYGETSFFLKSERKPLAASDGCVITPVTDLYDTDYYVVTVSRPEFTINLGE